MIFSFIFIFVCSPSPFPLPLNPSKDQVGEDIAPDADSIEAPVTIVGKNYFTGIDHHVKRKGVMCETNVQKKKTKSNTTK